MNPVFDYHALAPELILTATIVIVLVADFFFGERERFQTSRLATIGVLAALVPILTLAADGTTRTMFGGAYVVDDYALALKGFFLLVAYITLLVSVDYIGEGDDLGEKPFERLAAEGKLVAYPHDGFWACMDTFKEKQSLEDMYSKGQPPWEVWRNGKGKKLQAG